MRKLSLCTHLIYCRYLSLLKLLCYKRLEGYLDNILSSHNTSRDSVLVVEMRSRDGGDEELGTVGVGSSIGH
jgi:hypothetical protein